MQVIVCQFSEYSLPDKPNWLDKLMMPLAETLETEGYKKDVEVAVRIEHPDLFLKSGSKFSVSGNLLNRKEEVHFILSNWYYEFNNDNEAVIRASVREIKPTPFTRWFSNLSDGSKYFIGFASFLLPAITIFFAYYTLKNYPQPSWFWSWFAEIIRGLVGWTLFISLLIADFYFQTRFKKSPFIQNLLLALFSVLLFLLPLVWLGVSVPPKPLATSPNEYISYLKHLRSEFIPSSLVVIGLAPWITLFLKWFGFDMLSSLFQLAVKKREQ